VSVVMPIRSLKLRECPFRSRPIRSTNKAKIVLRELEAKDHEEDAPTDDRRRAATRSEALLDLL
jgi:hypothetical protein